MIVRSAGPADLDALAHLWHDVWYETHAHLMPPELIRLRTLESFRERLAASLQSVRVVGQDGAPVGFCWVKGDELYQLWVAASARGSGVAAALMADAEARLAASGVQTAWLACAIGNDRAMLAPVNMLIMFDRSGSMEDDDKWPNATAALSAFLKHESAADMRVALRFFPHDEPAEGCSDEGCDAVACSRPLVEIAPQALRHAPQFARDHDHRPAVFHAVAHVGVKFGDGIDQDQGQRHRDQHFDQRERAAKAPLRAHTCRHVPLPMTRRVVKPCLVPRGGAPGPAR